MEIRDYTATADTIVRIVAARKARDAQAAADALHSLAVLPTNATDNTLATADRETGGVS